MAVNVVTWLVQGQLPSLYAVSTYSKLISLVSLSSLGNYVFDVLCFKETVMQRRCTLDGFVIHNSYSYSRLTGFRQDCCIEYYIQFVSIRTAITVM